VAPSPSYTLELPEGAREEHDGRVSSFWITGHDDLLQVSSYLRIEGEQSGACERLAERMKSLPGEWSPLTAPPCDGVSPECACAEYVDPQGLHWLHCYLVWPHLTIYVTCSGAATLWRRADSWMVRALGGIRLVVH
jgi:hypothetical protein